MKVFLDTSVLVASVVQEHESHARAFVALDGVQGGKDEGFVSGHSLAEMYAVLTRLPAPMRHSPEQALLSIEENVVKHFKTTTLSGSEYAGLIREAALGGIEGGTVYDAILLKCAEKAKAEKIYTLNLKHFHNIASKAVASQVVAP